MFSFALPLAVARTITELSTARIAEALDELRSRIQEHLGDDRVYIETVELEPRGGNVGLRVRLRQRLDDDDDQAMQLSIEQLIEAWGRARGPQN